MHDQHRFQSSKRINKLTLSPGNFIETEQNSLLMKRLSDQITALRRDVGVILAEDLSMVSTLHSRHGDRNKELRRTREIYHQKLALDIPSSRKTVIIFARSEGLAVDIRRKVTHSRLDPTIEGTAVRKMSTQTHASGTDPAIASGQREEVVHTQTSVLVIGGQFLLQRSQPQYP